MQLKMTLLLIAAKINNFHKTCIAATLCLRHNIFQTYKEIQSKKKKKFQTHFPTLDLFEWFCFNSLCGG